MYFVLCNEGRDRWSIDSLRKNPTKQGCYYPNAYSVHQRSIGESVIMVNFQLERPKEKYTHMKEDKSDQDSSDEQPQCRH